MAHLEEGDGAKNAAEWWRCSKPRNKEAQNWMLLETIFL